MQKHLPLILACCAILVACFAVFMSVSDERGEHLVTWQIYNGQIDTDNGSYRFTINEADRGYGFTRMLFLKYEDGPSYAGITGHDYNANGVWDRIFYCGNHELVGESERSGYGCNSVERSWVGGDWTFKPCPADEGKIEPFSNTAIGFAIDELNAALALRSDTTLFQLHEWSEKEQRVVKTYDRSEQPKLGPSVSA